MNGAPSSNNSPLERLRSVGEKLPSRLRTEILALGPQAITPLAEMLNDEALAAEDSPHGGWAPIHAVDLLVDLGSAEAAAPLVETLAVTSIDEIQHDRIAKRLPELGPAVVEPALAALAEGVEPDNFATFCFVLAGLAVKDARIYAHLLALLTQDPVFGSVCLANYGDVKAVPLLDAAIRSYDAESTNSFGVQGLEDLLDSRERLGGPLPAELRSRVTELRKRAHEHEHESAAVSDGPIKVGRNEPCPCGSGKKYKKCHGLE